MSRRAGYPGTFWPSEHHERGLRAALLSGDDGRSAWNLWRDRLDLDGELDSDTYRLLPLVAHNLLVMGVDDPLLGRLAGVRRRAWYHNQLSFSQLGSALRYLESHSIPTMVLGGAALAVTAYSDAGLRPVADLGVLVPFEDTARSLRALEADGWARRTRYPGGVRGIRAEVLSRGDGPQIHLHRHLMPDLVYRRRPERSSAGIWRAAVPISIGGVDTRVPFSAHQLLHVVVQGASAAAAHQIGWVADAVHVLRAAERAGAPLDWDVLLRLAQARRVSLAAEATLRYLAEGFDAAVPEAVLADLAQSPVTARDRTLFWARSSRPLYALPEQVNAIAGVPRR